MSNDHLAKLEEKVQHVVDTVSIQKMELEELREQKAKLEEENATLREELANWSDRLGSLLGRLEGVAEEV
ncbi:cell division protein ZapB [Zooshikella marina]|uniref:Cell division protein ZapB n=1 Tax=Zooshikella ganghwensis TaxID=202772 RepID=A0A4P9VJ67_9GAMM|nr:cell division protein ZapB [Zooshikella ganghwensis]MBU2704517.1 cell division protein ZapB [Zooshikella ganghwensis]RDH43295.1 cell division protein ZapB [Zooshikella ganghwensis]